ncbi:DUF5666 domain-containing protein [Teredinibacter sp. KSP-S5-2]|uniref:DUF5666 domain-containing protein n=1 Tax=Teredinibacter sp. KSP-S5-2 TaxID=3034506 RepID=UPI0029351685|nr:DUF5666 domain-containing protein [Teredinibacter sp. KSP-S5-2]WNO09800.1 DUF5666 domain-containing protein [Teredinibacter sp. KSP-S5-2]
MKSLKPLFYSLLVILFCACSPNGAQLYVIQEDDDYGIGGTGIIGQITGFGSIFVNGKEIELTEHSLIQVNGSTVEDYAFNIGDVVEVLAGEQAYTHAEAINIRHELIGPVSAFNAESRELVVLGKSVIAPKSMDINNIAVGEFVAVSGFELSTSRIHATRIADSSNRILLRGNKQSVLDSLSVFDVNEQVLNQVHRASEQMVIQANVENQKLSSVIVRERQRLPYEQAKNWLIQGAPSVYLDDRQLASMPKGLNAYTEDTILIWEYQPVKGSIKWLDARDMPKGERSKNVGRQYRQPVRSGGVRGQNPTGSRHGKR